MGVQGGPQLALIPTVAQYAQQASTLSKQVWLHAYDALQVEEVRLEVTMLITTRLWTAPFVPLEDIVHKLGEQQAMSTSSQDAQSV